MDTIVFRTNINTHLSLRCIRVIPVMLLMQCTPPSKCAYHNWGIKYANLHLCSGSFFPASAPEVSGSYEGFSWDAHTPGDNMIIEPYEPDLTYVPMSRFILILYIALCLPYFRSLAPVALGHASGLDDPPHSPPEHLGSPVDASQSRPRFACHHPQCGGRTFNRRADRDRHARKHDEVRQYDCPTNCGRKFYRKDKLQVHLHTVHQRERGTHAIQFTNRNREGKKAGAS